MLLGHGGEGASALLKSNFGTDDAPVTAAEEPLPTRDGEEWTWRPD
jgi:hypothetical protein